MISCEEILQKSGVVESLNPWEVVGPYKVYLTKSDQIVGTYSALRQFRQKHNDLYGKKGSIDPWEAHHILELNQLSNLRISHKFPGKNDCLCVLIPKPAHGRINSRLISFARKFIGIRSILEGYHDAHETIGNYNGTGESEIKKELDSIVETSLKLALA